MGILNFEILGFFCLRDSTWNQIRSICSPKKTAILTIWATQNFKWIFWNVWHFQVCSFSKNQNSKPPKLLKRQFVNFWNQPQLISCKCMRFAEKLLNYHSMEYTKRKVPIRLPRSVCIYKTLAIKVTRLFWKKVISIDALFSRKNLI